MNIYTQFESEEKALGKKQPLPEMLDENGKPIGGGKKSNFDQLLQATDEELFDLEKGGSPYGRTNHVKMNIQSASHYN